jgi:hypothetical protein
MTFRILKILGKKEKTDEEGGLNRAG